MSRRAVAERWLLRLPAGLLSALTLSAILYLTLVPRPLPPMEVQLWEHTDKVVHALMMAGMVWAASLDMMRRSRTRLERMRLAQLIAVAVATVALGGGIEILQDAMGMGRGGDWADFAADTAGAIAAATVTGLIPWPSPRRR